LRKVSDYQSLFDTTKMCIKYHKIDHKWHLTSIYY
jgi:hypothetical protein